MSVLFYRELTEKEKRMLRQSVIQNCACYDMQQGGLPLDGDCYMMKIGFTNSSLCRYYEKMILPGEPEILNIFYKDNGNFKICKYCGIKFTAYGNKQYCSDKCSLIARRKATAKRMRKSRKNRHEM